MTDLPPGIATAKISMDRIFMLKSMLVDRNVFSHKLRTALPANRNPSLRIESLFINLYFNMDYSL